MSKILVIEDDFYVRSSIAELLKEEGFDTIEAENGRDGIEIARKAFPDLIISDILMPETDGYAVLKEMQKDAGTAAIPFIFLSACNDVSAIRNGMNGGADDFLTKPYKTIDLLNAVNSRLNKKDKAEKRFDDIFKSITLSLPHEFRTPLVSIIGFSQVIKENFYTINSKEIVDMAEKINSSGYDLLRLIEKFLTFSELELLSADKKACSKVNSSLVNSTDNILYIIAHQVAKKFGRKSDLKMDITNASVRIEGDNLRLLFSEILENAFKFSYPGAPVEVTAGINEEGYCIEIKDYGIGMTHDQVKKLGVLRQFNRSKNGRRGTGLGLGIVKKICELHNINFEIESVPDKGTTVKTLLQAG